MVNRNLLRQFDVSEDEFQAQLDAAFPESGADWLPVEAQSFQDNKLVPGRVRKVTAETVWLDVGYKSEGAIDLQEWFDEDTQKMTPPKEGDVVEVLVEAMEDEAGAVVLSY